MTTKTASSSSGHVCRGHLYEPFRCRLESVADLTPVEKLFRLTRRDGKPFGHKPGQFMMVSIGGIGEAPISVSSSPSRGAYLELGVRKTGVLTAALHALGAGGGAGPSRSVRNVLRRRGHERQGPAADLGRVRAGPDAGPDPVPGGPSGRLRPRDDSLRRQVPPGHALQRRVEPRGGSLRPWIVV